MTQAPPAPQTGPENTRPYADAVLAYARAGWPCILPVPPATKTPPPTGFTGAEGRDTEPLDLVGWSRSHAGHSIALRLPDGVVGIDVDEYEKAGTRKHGAATLAAREAEWGALPSTWSSTARGGPDGPGPSRILLFRAPAGRYATRLGAAQSDGSSTGDVEIIQRHHRYAVVWPSPHPGAGATYRWYDPAGRPVDRPPAPTELAGLPAAWVAGLAEGAAASAPASADRAAGGDLLGQILDDWSPECAELTSARLHATDVLARAEEGSRHDVMTERVYQVVMLAAGGHTGAAYAVTELRDAWARLTAAEAREDEFERMLLTAARKAVTAYGRRRVTRDPCLLMAGGITGLPGQGHAEGAPVETGRAPADGEQVEAPLLAEPPRWSSVREVIGTHAFDPNAGHDQSLAEHVLARTWPALRYAYDANSWLLRAPDRWEVHGRLSTWAVATVAPLMPVGDPTAEKDTEPYARHQRRGRLMSTAGARAVAGKMDDLVAGGMHPVALSLAGLDADPEVMWAGSMPYSLRASLEGPAFAELDPATPHIRTAAVTPETRPTPLWDAFLAAVWPDPAVRAWALRVLSIALTGYADRALPILLGETGRGKTQVVHLLMSVLGTYAHSANPKLLGSNTNEHDTIIYDLKGRRLSFIDEGPSERKAGQERLKQLTGGGDLTGRQMNQDPITFAASHTFVLTSNEEPVLTDPAVRARTRLIPCDGDPEAVRTTRAAIGHVTGAAWRVEAPGVLAALMAQTAAWLADPATGQVGAAPESIRYLAEHLGAEQDPVSVWVREETEPWPAGTPSRELYQAFVASCRANSMNRDLIPTETKWGRTLGHLGYAPIHTEHGKRRPLRVRPQGFWTPSVSVDPDLTGSQAPTRQEPAILSRPSTETTAEVDNPDGLTPTADGLLTGLEPNPSGTKQQVNPTVSVRPDGSDGLKTPIHTHAPASPAPESRPDFSREPVSESVEAPSVRPKRERSAEATARAASAKAERRAAAIAEAGGLVIGLPAVVTRDGAVRAADLATVDRLLDILTADSGPGTLTVDVEHTGYPLGHEHYALRTVQLGGPHFAVVLDATDTGADNGIGIGSQAGIVRRHLEAARTLHAHSATADLVPLADAGMVDYEAAWAKMLDTGILAKLSDPSSTGNDADLKGLAKNVLGPHAVAPAAEEARKRLFKAGGWLTDTEVTTPLERSGWAQVDAGCETMIRYAASDVLDCAALAETLPRPDPAVLDRELTVQRMTARIALHGIRLDADHVSAKRTEHREARTELAAAVRAQTAGLGETGEPGPSDSAAVTNPGSPQQVGRALLALGAHLPRTATGRPSAAAAVLEPLAKTRDQGGGAAAGLARTVLDWRHHDTALKLLLEPYHELVTRGDGRARPTVYTLGADTGRMSSARPNVQQVSREGGMRACFTADPGDVLISADFAGVELRVAAALSQDQNLRAIMDDPDRDLHWEIARIAFGPGATKSQRYAVKRGVFGRIYGGGLEAVAAGVGVSHAVAQQVIDTMDQLTPQLAGWAAVVRQAIQAGHTTFPAYSGRTIHLPAAAPHAGPNYCIQGTARELLVDALLRWAETPWGHSPLFPVHDELVVAVPEADAREATDALVACMTTELYGVAIKAEASEPSFEWRDSA